MNEEIRQELESKHKKFIKERNEMLMSQQKRIKELIGVCKEIKTKYSIEKGCDNYY